MFKEERILDQIEIVYIHLNLLETMTELFPSQFLKQGRMFKMGYLHTKMELTEQRNQTEAASSVPQAVPQQLGTTLTESEQ